MVVNRHILALAASFLATSHALADSPGYAALVARLGSATPTGAGIGVVQVESPLATDSTAYSPDVSQSEFIGKAVTRMNTPYAISSHATYVASYLYGANTSMAKGVANIWAFNVSNWIVDNLKIGTGVTLPTTQPNASVRVQNNSWLASYGMGKEIYDREAVRRMDYSMYRDGVLAVNGENNGAGSIRYPMMGDCFNGLSVGRLDLQHSAGVTASASDTPGRMKPELIAPGQATSYCTPTVGAAAALLFQQAQLAGAPTAGLSAMAKAQVVKVSLLAGATRDASWSNQAPQSGALRGVTAKPLDPLRGAGALDINVAHQIISAAKDNGNAVAVNATQSNRVGFASISMSAAQQVYWRFRVTQLTPTLDFVITWPRVVASGFASYTLANIDLRVRRALSGASTLQALEGDAGVACIGGGNVSSASAVDNIEIIHLSNLQQGEYVVEMTRVDSGGAVQVSAGWQVDPLGFGIEGDIDGSGLLDSGDISQVLLNMGTTDPGSDVDMNGYVDTADVSMILLNM
jgi:hypothetical protein